MSGSTTFIIGNDGETRIVADDATAFARDASAASATLSQAWAEGTLPGGAGTKSAREWAGDAEGFADDADTSANVASQARDVAIAAGVTYPSVAAAVAGLADGAFGSYLDPMGNPVWGQRTGATMTPLPGPWIGGERVGFTQSGTGAVARTVQDKLREVVSVKDFGAVGDGATDDTAAIQAALDDGSPVEIPDGEYLVTDTLLLEPGASIIGAGGVANYDASRVKIKFNPATKRDLFKWRSPPLSVSVILEGVRIEGFCVRGFGPGAAACLDLPYCYNARINFFAFAGVDTWVRMRAWIDSELRGGAQGFRVYGVEFYGGGIIAGDVTTSTTIDAYISQGPSAYYAANRAVTDAKITGVIESVDKASDIARGNVLYFDIYTENVPRTDAGSAWEFGKTGTSPAGETALHLNLRPGIGYAGGALLNANLLDVDHVRYVRLSGYSFLYATLLKTTANTRKVAIVGLDTDNIAAFSTSSGVADYAAISAFGFNPATMELVPGGGFFDGSSLTPNLQLWPRSRATVTRGQMFVDADFGGKLRFRDQFGNFSDPIARLSVSGNSGWTVQGGRLTPGEIVRNSLVGLGEVGLWQSMRHSRDTATSVASCSITSGSPVVSKTAGAFAAIEVGDFVTASVGYNDPTVQVRVVSKAADNSSMTLEFNFIATSSTVTIATEAHQLVPMTQQGFRSFGADPTGVLVPKFLGEDVFRSDNSTWYRSTGLTSADWKLLA